MTRRMIFLQWLRIIAGLCVFAFGVHLTIYADIGLSPWDCLGMGISFHTPLNYGLSMMSVAVIVLVIDLFMKERIGFGTIIDTLFTSNCVQFFNDINPFGPNESMFWGVVIMLAGFAFMALGMMIYMQGGQGCGPRDALLVGIGKRMPGVPVGIVEIILWGAVLIGGWLLDGPVGVGTLLSVFGAGLVMQVVYYVLRFEPREIKHKSFGETLEVIIHD